MGRFFSRKGGNSNGHVHMPVTSFIIANGIKVALFNMLLIGSWSLAMVSYKLLFSLLISVLAGFLLFKPGKRLLLVFFYVLQALYIFANLAYFLYFKSYLHLFNSLAVLNEGLWAVGNLAFPWDIKLLVAVVDIPFFIYAFLRMPRAAKPAVNSPWARKAVLVCLAVLLVLEGVNFAYSCSLYHVVKGRVGESLLVERYGTLLNSIVSFSSIKNEKKLIESFDYGPVTSGNKTGQGEGPNIVIIQVEAMDAHIVRHKYEGQYVMPFLNSLADKSVYYPYVMSYHTAGGTSDAEFSIINGVEPLHTFPSIKLSSYTYPNSMIKELTKNSYTALAFHGNYGNYFNRDVAFRKMGFDSLFDMVDMGLRHVGWGAPDEEVFNFTKGELNKAKEPFLAYIITMTSHGPYTNARHYYNNPRYDRIGDEVVRNYFNSMSYVDQVLEDFVNFVTSRWDNTYIIIFGDHTPAISNEYFKQASFKEESRYFEFVPLFILTPDGRTYVEEKEAASFLDIAPTVLKASGAPFTIRSGGIDLLNRPEVSPPIPFKDGKFDRAKLYEKAAAIK